MSTNPLEVLGPIAGFLAPAIEPPRGEPCNYYELPIGKVGRVGSHVYGRAEDGAVLRLDKRRDVERAVRKIHRIRGRERAREAFRAEKRQRKEARRALAALRRVTG